MLDGDERKRNGSVGREGVLRGVSSPLQEVFGRDYYREHILGTRLRVLYQYLQLVFMTDLV